MGLLELSEEEIGRLLADSVEFAKGQSERFAGRAAALTEAQKASVAGFFSDQTLDAARVIVLEEETVANPEFIPELRSRGFPAIFDLNHLNAVPFGDVLVYHDTLNKRLLFHGLVHLVQQRLLGMERWLNFYLRGVLKTGLQVTIPLEVHAFELDGRFRMSPAAVFSVEKEVRDWVESGRYA